MISINYRLTQLDSLLFWMLQLKGILHQHIIFHNKYLILIFIEWGVVLTIFHKPHKLDKMIKKFNLIFVQHSFDRREKEQLGLQHDISCLVVCLPVHYGAGSGNKAIKIFKVQNWYTRMFWPNQMIFLEMV